MPINLPTYEKFDDVRYKQSTKPIILVECPLYQIDSTNNQLYVRENDSDHDDYQIKLTVSEGIYTGEQLATILSLELTSLSKNDYIYLCTYETNDKKFILELGDVGNNLKILINESSFLSTIAPQIGFSVDSGFNLKSIKSDTDSIPNYTKLYFASKEIIAGHKNDFENDYFDEVSVTGGFSQLSQSIMSSGGFGTPGNFELDIVNQALKSDLLNEIDSFNNIEMIVYLLFEDSDTLTFENKVLLFTGKVSEYYLSNDSIKLVIADKKIQNEHSIPARKITENNFPKLDKEFSNKPIQIVYGNWKELDANSEEVPPYHENIFRAIPSSGVVDEIWQEHVFGDHQFLDNNDIYTWVDDLNVFAKLKSAPDTSEPKKISSSFKYDIDGDNSRKKLSQWVMMDLEYRFKTFSEYISDVSGNVENLVDIDYSNYCQLVNADLLALVLPEVDSPGKIELKSVANIDHDAGIKINSGNISGTGNASVLFYGWDFTNDKVDTEDQTLFLESGTTNTKYLNVNESNGISSYHFPLSYINLLPDYIWKENMLFTYLINVAGNLTINLKDITFFYTNITAFRNLRVDQLTKYDLDTDFVNIYFDNDYYHEVRYNNFHNKLIYVTGQGKPYSSWITDGDRDVGKTTSDFIENPAHIIEDIVRIAGLNTVDIDIATFDNAFSYFDGTNTDNEIWKFSFVLNEEKPWKEHVADIAKHCKSRVWFSADNKLKISVYDESKGFSKSGNDDPVSIDIFTTDPEFADGKFDSNPIINNSFSLSSSPLEEIYNAVYLNHYYMHPIDRFTRTAFIDIDNSSEGTQVVDPVRDEGLEKDAMDSKNKYGVRRVLELDSPYIADDNTAIQLRDHLFNYYKNERKIVSFVTKMSACHLDLCDIINIRCKILEGIYTIDIMETKKWEVTSIKKRLNNKEYEITAIELNVG